MRIAKIIGTVTLNRSLPEFAGASLRLAVPMSLANLSGSEEPAAEELVLWDEFGSGVGELVALSEGGEAAQPFRPHDKPVDAYNAAILDEIDLNPAQIRKLKTNH
ncbi:MAG: EutN/CcmL family microcompartment protein [Planctomycetaceae bacterium]|nr:EutN/CcmL family microcompartment protein [Planctomycetales bacterium]MCB9927010.1 EutN/CcmL family microcompartment protein [Planctomycetaceae bacterium]